MPESGDQLSAYLVRLLDFLTKVLNDPNINLTDSAEYKSIVAGMHLSNNDFSGSNYAEINDKFMNFASKMEAYENNAAARLQVAKSRQEMLAAQEDMEKVRQMFEMLTKMLQQQNDMSRSVIQNIRG